jgi:HK97 family phage prohead protease
MERELRTLPVCEVRATTSADDTEHRLWGYAAVYGVLSKPLATGDGKTFRERIQRNAFDSVLAGKPDVTMNLNHDNNAILGRTTSGTLTLRADDKGLAYNCLLPNTTAGRDAYESARRGDLNGMSFAFADADSEWAEEDEEPYQLGPGVRGYLGKAERFIVRTIKSFGKLFDVSLVTTPAYNGTSVDVRNLVGAECRARLESLTRPRTPAAWRGKDFDAEFAARGNAFIEELIASGDFAFPAYEQGVIRRRRELLDQVL